MKKINKESYTVLITGVGAIIGQGIIKSLKMAAVQSRLIGIDCNPFSVGFNWAEVGYIVPRVGKKDWLDAIMNICRDESVDLILPGIEQDVRAFIHHRSVIEGNTGAYILLNSPLALQVGLDKWELYLFAVKNCIKVPDTWLATNSKEVYAKYPVLLKPRKGMAGKGIYKVSSPAELEECLARLASDEYIIQKYIGTDEDEYTVSVFGYSDGSISRPILLRRRLNYGSTFEAEIIIDQELEDNATSIAKKLSICGPTNFQFRKADRKYYLIEVNPRFSSSTSIKSAFGFNEPVMAINSFLRKISIEPITIKRGRCSRYIEDLVVYE